MPTFMNMLTTLGFDTFGHQTVSYAIPSGTYRTSVYTVNWSLTAGGSGHVTVASVDGPTRTGAGSWMETLTIPVAYLNLSANRTLVLPVLYTGSGTATVTAAHASGTSY